jgi:hexosaminidase
VRSLLITTAAATLLISARPAAVQAPARRQEQELALVPYPREVRGTAPPVIVSGPVVIAPGSDTSAAAVFLESLSDRHVEARIGGGSGWRVEVLRNGTDAASRALSDARTTFDAVMRDEGYVLLVNAAGARVIGATDAGVFYGLQSLAQLFGTSPLGPTVRPATIRDWPAMRWRGVHDDLSRGPIPTLAYQKRQIRTAAAFKINVWSPYYEHTLEYRSQPLIAIPGASMSQDDVRELVRYAERYHVTIVPEQEAFGHLHHVLKNELYAGMAETQYGHVLAPMDPRVLPLIRDWFSEIAELFPAPFIHLGADETFELGRGRTKARIDSVGIGPVYLGFLRDIETTLRPITNKRFLFWGDVAGNHPDLVRLLPKDMIAVAWNYGGTRNLDRLLRPFRDAGLETWAAPGVNNWDRVWPNNAVALPNIAAFARDAQAVGSTGLLNTTWDDDGDAVFEETWYGVLFGAAAAWQPAEPNTDATIARFQRAYGHAFHGDTTGLIDSAQLSLSAAHAALQRTRISDASTFLFFVDPWSNEGALLVDTLRRVLPEVRLHAESALVYIAQARRQTHLRETSALDAMELGARRIDWLAAKFLFADFIAKAFANASADTARARQYLGELSGINGRFQDMRDGFALTRDMFEQAWRRENRPYWLTNALARFDVEIQRWVNRTAQFDLAMRRWSRERVPPRPEDVGIPERLVRR